jgi:hypothetical protein
LAADIATGHDHRQLVRHQGAADFRAHGRAVGQPLGPAEVEALPSFLASPTSACLIASGLFST